jgi:hypothetical protein
MMINLGKYQVQYKVGNEWRIYSYRKFFIDAERDQRHELIGYETRILGV